MKLRKGSAAAKAWGAKMRRLRTGITKKVKRRKSAKVKRSRGGSKMAKKRGFKRRAAGGILGGGSMMNGIIKPRGMLQSALIGIGAAATARQFINVHPLQDEAIGFATGGVIGAASVFITKNATKLIGNVSGVQTGGSW